MKERSPFEEARPRTPRGAARQREIEAMNDIDRLSKINDEEEYKRSLADLYGIVPGHPRYEKALAIWRELQRGKL